MTCTAKYIFSEDLLHYHFHKDHPFDQKRVLLTTELLQYAGLLNDSDIVPPRKATDEEIKLFHDHAYVEAVKRASKQSLPEQEAVEFGLGTEDTPIFPDMHHASAFLVGGTLTAVDEVLSGRAKHVSNLGGGLHHGFKRKASGFCIYNDGAIAIRYIREKYNLRVLYVDTDAHHGDGVQWAFYDDPNVCTFSIHETGRYLFPGTGNVNERGIKKGHGYSFNLPVDAFTEDESFLCVFTTALKEIAAFFKPDIIVSQNGADAHCYDPLSHLCCTMTIYETIPQLTHQLAHQYCNGKWIALGGGGYDMWRVAPRAWAQVWNVMHLGLPASGPLPEKWISKWKEKSPVALPTHWEDDPSIVPYIPRKEEISEKNDISLRQLLKYTTLNTPADK